MSTFTASPYKWLNKSADLVVCGRHADTDLAKAIGSDPKATAHGEWERVGIADLQKVANRYGHLCHECHRIAIGG